MVREIDGFAYLLQLIGYRTWEISPTVGEISLEDARLGAQIAREEMEDRILAASYREFSPADIKFLEAMSLDKHDSAIADITARLGWASSQVGQYRRRLIKAGAIGERARGIVGFDMPYLKDYVAKRLGEANHG